MTTEPDRQVPEEKPKPPSRGDLARDVRRLVRRALKGALATLDRGSAHPYASLVTVATDAAGHPVLLLSRLALHTQNILADGRASLLIDGTDAVGDPLAGGRVTLMGEISGEMSPSDAPSMRARFLARHPAAAMYAGFSDFAFYRLAIARAHYVGGFGRIIDFTAAEVTASLAKAEPLLAAEADIVQHMNEDHADAVALYAARLAGKDAGAGWRLTGVDPEGFDLVAHGDTARIDFGAPVTSPAGIREAFVRLAAEARSSAG